MPSNSVIIEFTQTFTVCFIFKVIQMLVYLSIDILRFHGRVAYIARKILTDSRRPLTCTGGKGLQETSFLNSSGKY